MVHSLEFKKFSFLKLQPPGENSIGLKGPTQASTSNIRLWSGPKFPNS